MFFPSNPGYPGVGTDLILIHVIIIYSRELCLRLSVVTYLRVGHGVDIRCSGLSTEGLSNLVVIRDVEEPEKEEEKPLVGRGNKGNYR